MSSWLNFNDSFNNIKGKITDIATNVLAPDEGILILMCNVNKICFDHVFDSTDVNF